MLSPLSFLDTGSFSVYVILKVGLHLDYFRFYVVYLDSQYTVTDIRQCLVQKIDKNCRSISTNAHN